jgi:hypothetical protein
LKLLLLLVNLMPMMTGKATAGTEATAIAQHIEHKYHLHVHI